MEIVLIIFLSILLFFFCGAETGLLSINRIKLHTYLEKKKRTAYIVEFLIKNLESVNGAILIGTNICHVSLAIVITNLFSHIIKNEYLLPTIVTLVATPFIVIFAELLPKYLFREFADKIIYFLSPLILFFYIILYPVQVVILKTIKLILSLIGIKKKKGLFSKEEFNVLLDMVSDKGIIKQNEKQFIESIMNFKNLKAKEIMIPLIRMTCIEENDTVEIAASLMMTTKHSRIPVFRMRVDNMIGYIENKDILNANKNDKVSKYLKQAVKVPGTAYINQVLLEMQKTKSQIALVYDEYGGVEGVITNQDIITEIIGEFVPLDKNMIKKENGYYIVNGMTEIDDINEYFNLNIVKNDFETIAGYCLYKFQRIPSVGESFEENKYIFEVESIVNSRISKIKIIPKKEKRKRSNEKKDKTK